MDDLISRQAAIEINQSYHGQMPNEVNHRIWKEINELPSALPETCEGCKHLGKWENEFEYGYPSPCTRCKRRVEDHYER